MTKVTRIFFCQQPVPSPDTRRCGASLSLEQPAQSPSWGTQTQVARSCWWICRGTSRAASQLLQGGRPCVTRTHRVWPVGRKTGIGSFFSTHFLLTPYYYC